MTSGEIMTSGYLSCSFDLLNVGDLDVIAQARTRCDRLVVGVYSDEFVLQRLGRLPVVPLTERIALLEHVRGVDEVVVHGELGHAQRPGWTYFVLTDDAGDPGSDHLPEHVEVVRLTSGRQTASTVLLDALRPVLDEAVA